jgi:hypothetical protein
MGLLDEAIREHLELKRRRGADPTEVERLEREALGPVRRGADAPGDHPMEDAEAARPVADPDEEMEDGWLESGHEEPVFDHEEESDEGAPRHHEIAEELDSDEPLDLNEPPEPTGPGEHFDDEPLTDEQPAAGAPPPGQAPAPAPAQADHLGEETVEYDVESEHLNKRKGEDVLEETPEFLQDTPDHDRLWFEQKPPKDFDFDG